MVVTFLLRTYYISRLLFLYITKNNYIRKKIEVCNVNKL